MNRPPEEYVLVAEERELAFLTECLVKSGMGSRDQAAQTARLLTNSELRGVRSHGIGFVPGYCRHFREGRLNPDPRIRVVHETATTAIVDGDGGLGYVPSLLAADKAVEKAKSAGVGLGLVRGIGHYGSAGHYTRRCMEAGCVGFSVQGYRGAGGQPGQDPKPSAGWTGAPPMSFAIPAGGEPGIVLDMVAHAVSGESREKVEDLLERVPATFFKSMGLVAAATLMGGAWRGSPFPRGTRSSSAGRGPISAAWSWPSTWPATSPRRPSTPRSTATWAPSAATTRPCPGTTRSSFPGTWRSGPWSCTAARGSVSESTSRGRPGT